MPKLSLYEFDVASGKTRELLTPALVLKGAEEHLSPEEKAKTFKVLTKGLTIVITQPTVYVVAEAAVVAKGADVQKAWKAWQEYLKSDVPWPDPR